MKFNHCVCFSTAVQLLLTLSLTISTAVANDLVRTSAGARSMGAGNVAHLGRDPLSAMSNNPALLVGQEAGIQISAETISVDSTFTTALGEAADADKGPGVIPALAFALPLDDYLTLGGAVSVRSALQAEFEFTDPPGTLGVSYGVQPHESEYVVLNAGFGLGYAITDRLSLGAGLNLTWNRNRLRAPYIFQSHDALQGLKVLVDLDVDDFTAGGMLGFNYRVTETLDIGLSYAFESDFGAEGELSGNLDQLGLGIQPDFQYDALVETGIPAFVSLGARWRAAPAFTLGAQIDRIHWDDTFVNLPIHLSAGSNAELNEFLDSSRIDDTAPLGWDRQTTWHLGGQYALSDATVLSLGLERSDVPVPPETMTAMTGAILKQAYSIGLSHDFGVSEVDIAYRLSDSDRVFVNNSSLAGGEYSNTALDLKLHTLNFTVRF